MKKVLSLLLIGVMILSLTGCKSKDYDNAKALMENGDYAGAIEAFTALEGYEDSAELMALCKDSLIKDALAIYDFAFASEFLFNEGEEFSAAYLEDISYSVIDYYYKEYGFKPENQQCIVDAMNAVDLAGGRDEKVYKLLESTADSFDSFAKWEAFAAFFEANGVEINALITDFGDAAKNADFEKGTAASEQARQLIDRFKAEYDCSDPQIAEMIDILESRIETAIGFRDAENEESYNAFGDMYKKTGSRLSDFSFAYNNYNSIIKSLRMILASTAIDFGYELSD